LWKVLKPTLKVVCIADEIKKFEERLAKASDAVAAEESVNKSIQTKGKKIEDEKNNLAKQLDELRSLGSDFGDKISRLQQNKQELDAQVNVSLS
jgi:chromosome segregation ATPase